MLHLIHESHDGQGAGEDGAIGMEVSFTHNIHAMRELANGGDVDKDSIACNREENIVKLIAITGFVGDMEFEGGEGWHLLASINAAADIEGDSDRWNETRQNHT
jgi:hypothetical protein